MWYKKYLALIIKYWGVVLILVPLLALFGALRYYHRYQTDEDKRVEAAMVTALNRDGSFFPGTYLPNARVICVLNPYADSRSIDVFLSDKARSDIDVRVTGAMGSGKQTWWLVGLAGGELVALQRLKTQVAAMQPGSEVHCAAVGNMVFDRVNARPWDGDAQVLFDIRHPGDQSTSASGHPLDNKAFR